jgi:hypothetical protein
LTAPVVSETAGAAAPAATQGRSWCAVLQASTINMVAIASGILGFCGDNFFSGLPHC